MLRRTFLLLFVVACATGPHVSRTLPRGDQQLVDVQRVDPRIAIDVRYATSNNFMHEPLYPVAKVFLRKPAALALRDIESELAPQGLGLKVFDGYRPYSVTKRMWDRIHNPDFVADPKQGSRHNRGAAVDLTLIDLKSGQELDMPTPYDAFTPKAAQTYSDLPPEELANRAKLRDVMIRHGFDPLPTEWWHFDYRGWKDFDLLDIPLQNLATMESEPTR